MTSAEIDKVKTYFHKIADDFDAIYSGRRSALSRTLDRTFRKDMYQRYHMTLELCSRLDRPSVLDIGCGSGRFCVPLAQNGARRVVGIDFAARMIEIAERMAAEAGVEGVCTFLQGDFLTYDFDETFDAVLAIGLFDYLADPETYLLKIGRLTSQQFVATYPRKWTYRMPLRKIRLGLKGCPVYFYTERQLKQLYESTGFEITSLQKVGKIYFVVASAKTTNSPARGNGVRH